MGLENKPSQEEPLAELHFLERQQLPLAKTFMVVEANLPLIKSVFQFPETSLKMWKKKWVFFPPACCITVCLGIWCVHHCPDTEQGGNHQPQGHRELVTTRTEPALEGLCGLAGWGAEPGPHLAAVSPETAPNSALPISTQGPARSPSMS